MHSIRFGFGGLSVLAVSMLFHSALAAEPFEQIRDRGEMTIGFANEVPFAYEEGGELKGEAPAVIRAIMKKHGIDKVKGVLTEFSALIPGLKAKRFDAIGAGMYIRPARCLEVDFSNPDIAVGEALIVKKGNPLKIYSYKDIAQNKSARMGVGRGGVEAELGPINGVGQDQLTIFADLTTLVAGLSASRVDVIGVPDISVADLLSKADDKELEKVKLTDQPVDKNGKPAIGYGATAFPKGNSEEVAAYNAALKELHDSGELLKLIEPFGFSETNIPAADINADQLCAQ